MAKQVIKKDGSKVAFDSKKIIRGITRAAQDAKLEPTEINKVVNQIANTVMIFAESKDKLTSTEIKNKVLEELDLVAPIVAKEWRKFVNSKRK
jgi:transcriptional regulator NrdR family protein